MKKLNFSVLAVSLLFSPLAFAKGDLSSTDVETVVLEMGSNSEGMYFKPNHLHFETGKAYKLIVRNVDKITHEIESNDFANKIFTNKVEIVDSNGDLFAEVKGSIREVEVGPGKEVEWHIVPVQTGEDMEMLCALPGHKEAGMHGLITVH